MQPPKKQCEELMTTLLPFAEMMLRDHGEFHPFGGVVDSAGTIHLLGAWSCGERRCSADIIKQLRIGMIRDAGTRQIIAAAILYDVRVVPPKQTAPTDAIAVDVDHQTGLSQTVVYPYRIQGPQLVVGKCYCIKNQHPVFQQH